MENIKLLFDSCYRLMSVDFTIYGVTTNFAQLFLFAILLSLFVYFVKGLID